MPENAVKERLVYRGPVQQVCYELSRHGYRAILVPDAVYELPADLAKSLLASNVNFQVAPPKSVFNSLQEQRPAVPESDSEQENI